MRRFCLLAAFCLTLSAAALAQAPAKIDFAHDVQPILRQNCTSCHGADDQEGNLRLDRRSSALKDGARTIVPGNTPNSLLYHRVIGDNQFGPLMPPQKPLTPDQVTTIQHWIEQGAVWPDALANEVNLPPIDPEAVAAVELLRTGATTRFLKAVTAKPALLNARGPEGSTPFMYAVFYVDAPMLQKLIKLGAKVNAHNDAGATPLLWGAHDPARAVVLIAAGADVNAKSDDFRTPLMIAARQPSNSATVKLLLDHGANPNPNEIAAAQSSPLVEAATAGDAASFAMILDHGARLMSDTGAVLSISIVTGCKHCVELVVPLIKDKRAFTGALTDTAYMADTATVTMLLDHGADANAYDTYGHTALMSAVTSDALPLETVKLLVAHGADVNAHSKHEHSGDSGRSVLDMALLHGKTPVSDFLIASGAQASPQAAVSVQPRYLRDIRSDIGGAVQASLPLLQRTDVTFAKNSGCVSCHNNSLTEMTVAGARRQGLHVDEAVAHAQLQVNADNLVKGRELWHQGFIIPVGDNFGDNVLAYMLIGLHEENYKPNLDTDAAAMMILWRQSPTGEWQEPHADTRQPLGLAFIGETALDLRALQLYAPTTDRPACDRSIKLAARWLATAQATNNDDRSWRTIGLAWAGTDKAALTTSIAELKSAQKRDGGWSDLPTMESSAYATGKSLVALHTAGMAATDPVYQHGVQWLLAHQQQDGSWFVQTRALAFQPWSDADFPHGYSQFISAAGTNWAAMALTLALPEKTQVAGLR